MQNHTASENNREIERLYRLDYGDFGELRFRMIGSLFGAGIIWIYTGWILAWVWIGVYAALQLAFFLFLRANLKNTTPTSVLVAHAIFPFLLASFIWMPILMITSPDDVLSVSGFTILTCVIIYVVRRSEEYLEMMLFEIGILAVFLGVGVAVILARYEDPLAWLGLIFGMLTMIFYVMQASVIVRRQRIRADEIAVRTSQAKKLEAIGKLAGGVAHDFNNLLTVILGNLDLIRETKDPKDHSEFLEEARLAALRGATVVRQLLTYARQTDGTPHVVDLRHLLESIEQLCRTFVPESIALTISFPSKGMRVVVDEAQFVTAMLNMIKNGIDAIEGPGQITVSATPLRLLQSHRCIAGQILPAGHFVVFAVADTGKGIPLDILDRVTDPFFTTKAVGSGSGLGLSMVSGFAIQSGGGMEIRSSGKGTVVSILLPEAKSQP